MMHEQQIDPYRLNDVLQRILEGISTLQERQASASPEFQILMGNYLTKANESERNQARFEEALERLESKDQEVKKIREENSELQSRLRIIERDFDSMRLDHDNQVSKLKEEISGLQKQKEELYSEISKKYDEELRQSTADLSKQVVYFREQFLEMQEEKTKMESKLGQYKADNELLEKELTQLKTGLAEEQMNIRNEILEATRRSSQTEKRFQEEKDRMLKRMRELESSVDELENSLSLKQRELEYKNALLEQAFKGSKAPRAMEEAIAHAPKFEKIEKIEKFEPNRFASQEQEISITGERTASDEFQKLAGEFPHETEENSESEEFSEKAQKKGKGLVGGIWSRLGS